MARPPHQPLPGSRTRANATVVALQNLDTQSAALASSSDVLAANQDREWQAGCGRARRQGGRPVAPGPRLLQPPSAALVTR